MQSKVFHSEFKSVWFTDFFIVKILEKLSNSCHEHHFFLDVHWPAYIPSIHPILAGWKRTLQSRNSFPCRTSDQRNVLL